MTARKRPAPPPEKKWVVRSVSLPVQEALSHAWPDFCRLLHASWRQSTDLLNWATHQLRRADVSRTPGMTELPPLAALDLYALAFGRKAARAGRARFRCSGCRRLFFPRECAGGAAAPPHAKGKAACPGAGRPAEAQAARALPALPPGYDGHEFWAGAKVAAAGLLRQADKKYRQERGKIVWRHERRTPEYLYPVPFPVPAQAWEVWFDGPRPVVSLALPGGRVSLRLRNGPAFAAAVEVLRRVEAGDLAKAELKLCRQRSACPDRKDRQAGVSYRVMVRVAYRAEVYDRAGEGSVTARTGADPFLTAACADRPPWLLHAPQVRGWVAAHRAFLDAFADDTKFEKRWPARKRRKLNRSRERNCDKHARRMKTFVQQAAAMLAGWAVRQGAGRLVWDDADRSFCAEFPWSALRQAVQHKCDELGLALMAASGAAASAAPEAALEATQDEAGGCAAHGVARPLA